MITRTDALHDALERLERYSYLDAPGFACHGPMGAETLSAMGHDEAVAGWVEQYKARHEALDVPAPCERLDPRDERSWRQALGDFSRVSDWAAMFGEELRQAPWEAVLQRWVPRLLPGHGGGMTHGVIRVAHGVRPLASQTSPSDLLIGELAKGLAFWAATYTPLPGAPELRGSAELPDAIAEVPRPRTKWSPIEAGTFVRLDELDGFAAGVEALGPPPSAGDSLSDLTAAFCRVIVAHPDVPAVPLVHTVTPTAAIRILLSHLPGQSIERLYAQSWHVSAAIVAGFTPSGQDRQRSEHLERLAELRVPTPTEVLERAAEHQETHALKFAEACMREHRVRPDDVYLLAAQHVLDQLPAW